MSGGIVCGDLFAFVVSSLTAAAADAGDVLHHPAD